MRSSRPRLAPAGVAGSLARTTLLALLLVGGPAAADDPTEIDAAAIDAIVRELADPSRGGRGPGSSGLEEARDLLVAHFEAIGLAPGADAGYLQEVPASAPDAGDGGHNVIGRIPGTGTGHVILGAHYDHLATETGDDGRPVVYPGADDNASGVAAMVEIARALLARSDEYGTLDRTVLVVAFTGEEQGLRGARHYVDHPVLPLDEAAAMINLDSVGRLRDDRLLVLGTGTADLWPDALSGLNRGYGFDLATSGDGLPTSDHAAFLEKGIPALQLFTDGHPDYHRPTDVVEKVNLDGVVRVAALTADLVEYLGDGSVRPAFTPPAAPETATPPAGEEPRRRRVSFGTIPDFARESGGVRVSGVLPGSAAEEAGVQVDDILVGFADASVDNLYDYQAALAARAPGDTVAVILLRDGQEITTRAVLRERR